MKIQSLAVKIDVGGNFRTEDTFGRQENEFLTTTQSMLQSNITFYQKKSLFGVVHCLMLN